MKKLLLFLSTLLSFNSFAVEQIDLTKIKKIYYLLASAKGFSRSAFGHGYLRLGIDEKPSSQDYVIEFVANSDEKNLDYLKALGIGENYDRVISIKKYSQVIPEMNNIANRDLESTEIILTDEQKEIFLDKLDLYLGMGKMYGYSFFTKNCAEAISDLINDTGIPFHGVKTVIPNAVPGLLKKHGIAGNTYTDYSLSNRRINLAKKYAPFILEGMKQANLNFKIDDLSADNIQMRVSAFTELQTNLSNIDPENAKGIRSYLSSFSFLENRLTRGVLIDQLQGNESIPLHQVIESKIKLFKTTEAKIKQSYLNFDGINFHLNHDIAIITSNHPKETPRAEIKTIKEVLKGIELKDETDLYLNNQLLGVLVPGWINSNRIIQTHSWVSTSSQFENGTLSITSIITSQKPLINSKIDYSSDLESDIKNVHKDMPMCFGLVEFEKKLLERTLFIPEEERLSDEENLRLLTDLIQNKMIVIPGFHNAREWSASLPLEDAKKIIYLDHKKKYGSVSGATANWFKQKSIDLDALKMIDSLTKKGIHTPVFFRTRNAIGHAILVTGLKQMSEDIYYIEGYDPNLKNGFTKDLFTFNVKNGKIKSPLYGESDLKFVPSETEKDLFYRDLSLDKNSIYFLKVASKKYKKYSFTITELMSGY